MWLSSGKKIRTRVPYGNLKLHIPSCPITLLSKLPFLAGLHNIIHLKKTLAIELSGCCSTSKITSTPHCVHQSETINIFISIIEQSCLLCWNLWTPPVHCRNEGAVRMGCFHARCRNWSLTGERGTVGERDIRHSVRAASPLWWEADWGVGAPGSLESRAVGPVHKMASFAAVACSRTVFSWTRETVVALFLVGVRQRYKEDSSSSFWGCAVIVLVRAGASFHQLQAQMHCCPQKSKSQWSAADDPRKQRACPNIPWRPRWRT